MKDLDQNSAVTQYLFFIIATALTILSAFTLAFCYDKLANPLLIDASVLVPWARVGLLPEPQERFVFLTLVVVVPIVSFLTTLMVFRSIRFKTFSLSKKITWLPCILICTTAALFYIPFIGYDFSPALVTNQPPPSNHPVIILVITVLAATGCLVMQLSRIGRSLSARFRHASTLVSWVIFGVVMLLQIGAWRIRSELSISQDWTWYGHAESIFYSLGQVMAGKTLLVDLPSLYGLFPEFLMPVFKLTGFSILNFTILCALLQMLSLVSIYWVVLCSIRDSIIRIAFGLTLIMLTFGTIVWRLGMPDPYYQYWPIRFFWPAIAVLLFYRYSNKPTLRRAFIVSLVGAVGTLWNTDSGLMIVLAFAGVLTAKWIVLWSADRHAYLVERRQLRNALINHVATFIIAGLTMLGYLSAKGEGALHFDWLIGSQKLFYSLGYMMLPMPLSPYPWMSILGIYLIALIIAARSWATNPHAKSADLLLFVSLLGLGLFLYYQGRSHPLNLTAVCWPALMLIALLTDRGLRAVRTGLLSKQHLILPIAGLSVLFFCSIPLVSSLGKLGKQVITVFENRNINVDALVSDELGFIRAHSAPGDECVIISRRQGLYFSAAGISSPISGPGFLEMFLMRDRDAFINQLTQKKYSCIFVGVGNSSVLDVGVDPMTLLQGYDITAQNQYGSMLYLQPRQGSATSVQRIIDRSAAYLQSNKINHAIALLKSTLITHPSNADLYNNLCVAYGVKTNYQDAISACENAVRIAPHYQLAINNLAWVKHEKETQKQ